MSSDPVQTTDVPVTVVLHRRIDPEQDAEYGEWQERISARVVGWPGFVERRVLPPRLPSQPDWMIIQRFRNADAARSWIESDEMAALQTESERFSGIDSVHLIAEKDAREQPEYASVIISSRVPAELETEFLDWQRRVEEAQTKFDGFLGQRVERPVPGVQEDWVVVLTFDTDEHLTAWIDSPQRVKLLAEGERFNDALTLTRTSYGFGFWNKQPGQQQDSVFKSNLLVLLMLYPVVFLWGYFVGDPLLGKALGLPFWLALFIGNVFSTQVLGFWLAPLAFKWFAWWMKPKPGWRTQLLGYSILIGLYLISMGLYAVLLAFPL